MKNVFRKGIKDRETEKREGRKEKKRKEKSDGMREKEGWDVFYEGNSKKGL